MPHQSLPGLWRLSNLLFGAFLTLTYVPASAANAAAAGVVLIVMTLLMNGLAIYLRYQIRKNIKW